jgi:hypothetical protein
VLLLNHPVEAEIPGSGIFVIRTGKQDARKVVIDLDPEDSLNAGGGPVCRMGRNLQRFAATQLATTFLNLGWPSRASRAACRLHKKVLPRWRVERELLVFAKMPVCTGGRIGTPPNWW